MQTVWATREPIIYIFSSGIGADGILVWEDSDALWTHMQFQKGCTEAKYNM